MKSVIEWTSVLDGYPKKKQEVLVLTDERKLNIAIFYREHRTKKPFFILKPWIDMEDRDFITVRSIHNVTHWAEITNIVAEK